MLAQAMAAEQQENALKTARRNQYIQGLEAQRQQQAADLAARKESRISAENQRKADLKLQVDIENLTTNRGRLNLETRKYFTDSQREQAKMDYKLLDETRQTIMHRADQMQALNMRMYALAMQAGGGSKGMDAAKKDLNKVANTFAAIRNSISAWDQQPANRGRVVPDRNSEIGRAHV